MTEEDELHVNHPPAPLSRFDKKKSLIVIRLAKKYFRVLENSFNVSMRSRSNQNLEVLVFEERGKLEYPDKNLGAKERTDNKQTQPTYGVDTGI